MDYLSTSFQLITIVIFSMFCGVMVCILTSHVPVWKAMQPSQFLDWFSSYSGGISKATGAFGMLSLILPIVTIALIWRNSESRIFWIISLLLMIILFGITLSFFVKTNTAFMNKTISLELVPDTLVKWGKLHLIRIGVCSLSILSAIVGIIKYHN